MTSGRISMIALENIELPLNGCLSSASELFSIQCSDAAALVGMSVYKQAPYYYYYY